MTDTAYRHPAFIRADALPPDLGLLFPHSSEEAREWKPRIFRRALSMQVLAVAVPRVECAWSAYIAAVPGHNHQYEVDAVANNGTKLDESIARTLFPMFDAVPYAD